MRCAAWYTRSSAAADLRASTGTSSRPNSSAPASSTTVSATSLERMSLMFGRREPSGRIVIMLDSNASRSAPVMVRTRTLPPHSGTATSSVRRSEASRIWSFESVIRRTPSQAVDRAADADVDGGLRDRVDAAGEAELLHEAVEGDDVRVRQRELEIADRATDLLGAQRDVAGVRAVVIDVDAELAGVDQAEAEFLGGAVEVGDVDFGRAAVEAAEVLHVRDVGEGDRRRGAGGGDGLAGAVDVDREGVRGDVAHAESQAVEQRGVDAGQAGERDHVAIVQAVRGAGDDGGVAERDRGDGFRTAAAGADGKDAALRGNCRGCHGEIGRAHV